MLCILRCFQTIKRYIQVFTYEIWREIYFINQREKAKIERNRVPPRQCEAPYILRHKLIVGKWCRHIAPTFHSWIYHLFTSLQTFLNGKNFNKNDDFKSHFIEFFVDEDQQLYFQGIKKLQEKWKNIEQGGKYLTD